METSTYDAREKTTLLLFFLDSALLFLLILLINARVIKGCFYIVCWYLRYFDLDLFHASGIKGLIHWFWFRRYLTSELILHLSQSSIRPSIYFSSIVKSRSNPFLEPRGSNPWPPHYESDVQPTTPPPLS